jgi:hypothetical protein
MEPSFFPAVEKEAVWPYPKNRRRHPPSFPHPLAMNQELPGAFHLRGIFKIILNPGKGFNRNCLFLFPPFILIVSVDYLD